jgi:hypothetical protein
MGPSGLHHHFKTLTNMTPLQYQKHLRLQEARRLMLTDATDASAAAYHVGYASRSQFTANTAVSLEPRHFGMRRDPATVSAGRTTDRSGLIGCWELFSSSNQNQLSTDPAGVVGS